MNFAAKASPISVAVGDFNGDTNPDLAVANINSNNVSVLLNQSQGGPTCLGHPATIVGTAGNDRIFGTSGPDVIVGLGGDDQLFGFGGDDIICGGDGNDVVDGSAGNDILDGQAGNDRVIGGLGNDDVRGGPGSDRVFANEGNDILDGGPDAPDYCNKGTGITTFANCEVFPAGM